MFSQFYKSYNEFLSFLKQIKNNPLKVIDSPVDDCSAVRSAQSYQSRSEDSRFQLDIGSPLYTCTDGIPSMSDLLSQGLRNRVRFKVINYNLSFYYIGYQTISHVDLKIVEITFRCRNMITLSLL